MVLGRGAGGRRRRDATGWPGCSATSTSFAKRKMNLGYRQARLLADAPIGRGGGGRCAATSSTIRGWSSRGSDAPLAELFDGQGQPLGPAGARRGQVSGTFFHAIAPELRPSCSSSCVIGIGTGNPEHMTIRRSGR